MRMLARPFRAEVWCSAAGSSIFLDKHRYPHRAMHDRRDELPSIHLEHGRGVSTTYGRRQGKPVMCQGIFRYKLSLSTVVKCHNLSLIVLFGFDEFKQDALVPQCLRSFSKFPFSSIFLTIFLIVRARVRPIRYLPFTHTGTIRTCTSMFEVLLYNFSNFQHFFYHNGAVSRDAPIHDY